MMIIGIPVRSVDKRYREIERKCGFGSRIRSDALHSFY